MIGDLFNEHYHHNKSLYDLLLCIQSLHVLMYGFITYFVMDKWRVWGTSFLTNPHHRVTRSRILTLVRTSVTLFQISPQCRTSRWSSRRPHRRSLQVSLSCPVLAVEYSTSCTAVQCTVYSRHPVQLSAHGPLLSGARLVTPARSGSHPLYSV